MVTPVFKQRGNRISTSINAVCMYILFIFVLFIGAFLAYYSLNYSYYSSTDYDTHIYLIKDNAVLNLIFFAFVCAVSIALSHFMKMLGDKQRKTGYIFLGICCLLYFIICHIWVTQLPYYPSGDQLNTTAAAHYNLEGNFIMFKKTGYLGKFPYQKGLTFIYEILFTLFGDFCYPVASRIHIILGVITMIFGYLFIEETSWNGVCKILYCPLALLCIPYLILTPYAYGDLPSICFCTVLFWALMRFARLGRLRYIVLGCIMASLSLMVRMHTWIVLIAVGIGMFLISLQKKKILPVITAFVITLSAFGTIKALDYSYAIRSGYEITEGCPMVLTLAMGLQDNENGPGTYNNYQTETMSSVDFNNDAAAEIAKENIRENLDRFRSDSSYAKWFFKTKLLMQWIEPSFETLVSTYSFDAKKTVPEWISDIYFGELHAPLMQFADRYQSIVYIGFLCFLPVLWQKRKESAAHYIPLIAIVGGFLFSIIWEAQCRYVLPYYMFMLVYVPDGICFVGTQFQNLISKLFKHSQNKIQ